jgi:phosphoglycolate phosphatase
VTPLLDEVLAIILALVSRIPMPDAVVRRARIVERLVHHRERLRARLERKPDDERARARLSSIEAALTVLTHPFEGVPELVQALLRHQRGWGVVTNKMERFTHPIVQGMALFDTAGAVVCGDTTPHPKPHPAPLLEAAQRMGNDPAHCVYVGDDERDIVAGQAAGMWTVAAHYGYLGQGVPASDWGAHAHIHSPIELLKILELD